MDIREFCLAHEFDLRKCSVMSGGGSFGLADLETSPVEFLSLAEHDFERGGLAARVNATANAKRAIVSQLDQLLTSFGYPSFRWNVPKKIERLRALGLLAPSLLRKVVDMRNVLEHEYITPEIGNVEEALDIASLFMMSASAIYAYEPGEYAAHCVGQCEIESGHVLFEAMVKLSASLMLQYKVNQALSDFKRAVT